MAGPAAKVRDAIVAYKKAPSPETRGAVAALLAVGPLAGDGGPLVSELATPEVTVTTEATRRMSDDALRAQDIVTAVKWLSTQAKGAQVEVMGVGKAAVWSRFAAAVLPVKVKLQAPVDAGFQGNDDELVRDFFVPHIQRAGGWRSAMLLTR